MQWTDKSRIIKYALVAAAIVIAVVSLVVSNLLVRDLADEERDRMEVWAEAMKSFSKADSTTDLNLVLKVIDENHTIPVVVMDAGGHAQAFRNVKVGGKSYEDSLKNAAALGKSMYASGKFIRMPLDENNPSDYIDVCYDESLMLKRLAAYPYVQLGVFLVFVVMAVFALLSSKHAEQDRVWAGLSRETAHQLGTPISSLMAWLEVLKEEYPHDDLLPEMDKDVQRLQLIAARFSRIGSKPELVEADLVGTVADVVDYMDRRTSRKVVMVRAFPEDRVIVKIDVQLFGWVIENLCKNAVDAMEGAGRLTVKIFREGKKAIIEVSDTGKGIRHKDLDNVFRPGFTTKKRGWGLGLSLARRIVEEYHKGRIFVKQSEVGKGTTFRIELEA